jgi:hypothetical protein
VRHRFTPRRDTLQLDRRRGTYAERSFGFACDLQTGLKASYKNDTTMSSWRQFSLRFLTLLKIAEVATFLLLSPSILGAAKFR